MTPVLILVFTLLIVATSGQSSIRNIDYLRSLSTFSTVTHCIDAKEELVKICSNGTTSEVCYNRQSVYIEFCVGTRPYCVEGECASKQTAGFACPTQYDYFPSLNTCNAFYICNEFKPHPVECPDRTVYDPELKACVRMSNTKPCHRFNCASKHLKYAAYPGDRRMYALCVKNQPAALGVCEKPDEGMDEAAQACGLYCKREGSMADRTDCKAYVECVLEAGTKYRITKKQCPEGMYFDKDGLVCKPGIDCK